MVILQQWPRFSQGAGILLVVWLALAGVAGHAGAASAAAAVVPQKTLFFERNQGQAPRAVRYLARGQDALVYVIPQGIVWAVPSGAGHGADVVRLSFPGGNKQVALTMEDILPGRAHYYTGSDPGNWIKDIALSGKVRYHAIFPGIDLVLYGAGGQLEYDFHIAPQADPQSIRLAFTGHEDLSLDGKGNLIVRLPGIRQIHRRPVAYQQIAGERRPVSVDFAIQGRHVALKVAAYDRDLPLVIDPVVDYAAYLGGGSDDAIRALAVGEAGDYYVAGRTQSADFPGLSAGATLKGYDAFVTRFDADDNLVYTAYLGSDDVTLNGDSAHAVAVDAQGNAHVTGVAEFGNFPVTANAFDEGFNGFPGDAFVSILDPGGALIYSTFLGGAGEDEGRGIAVDAAGDLYVTGSTRSVDFPVKSAYSAAYGGVRDAFLVKLRPASQGSADLLYGSFLGGGGGETARAIALAGADQVYIAGETNSTSGIATNGAFMVSGDGVQDAFVARFDTSAVGAASLAAATYLGGAGDQDGANVLAAGGASRVYVGGFTRSLGFPLSGDAADTVFSGAGEAFVSVLDSALVGLKFSTFLGGRGDEAVLGLFVDAGGEVHVTGWTDSDDFPATQEDLTTFPYGGGRDSFVSRLNGNNTLVYSFYFGGSGDEQAFGIGRDAQGYLYVTGETDSQDMPVSKAPAGFDGPRGGLDGFVVKLAPVADLVLAVSDNSPVRQGEVLTFDLEVVNQGPDTAENTVLTSTLEAGLAFASSSLSTCGYDSVSRIVSCNLGSLGVGQRVVFSISAAFDTSVSVTTAFQVAASPQVEGDPGDNSLQLTSAVDDGSPPPGLVVTEPESQPSSGRSGGGLLGWWTMLVFLIWRACPWRNRSLFIRNHHAVYGK